jgi:hypothetical protein
MFPNKLLIYVRIGTVHVTANSGIEVDGLPNGQSLGAQVAARAPES